VENEAVTNIVNTFIATGYSGSLTAHQGFAVCAVAYSPDGRTLATAGGDGMAVLWDVTDRQPPRQLGLLRLTSPTPHQNFASSCAVEFAPDGHTLTTASHDGAVAVWDVADRQAPRRLSQLLDAGRSAVSAVAFAPDGRTLATAGGDGAVTLWDVLDRQAPRQFGQPVTAQQSGVRAVEFASDGRTLATTDGGGGVVLWDVLDRQAPRQFGQRLKAHNSVVSGGGLCPGRRHHGHRR
jgi:eukaryotic-like serine/threonine-protein kinase